MPTPQPPPTPEPFEVEYSVREGHAGGAPVEGAEVALVYTAPDGASQVEIAQGTTDRSGRAAISVPGSHATAGEGQYEAVITYAGQTRRALLDRFPDVRQQTLYAPIRPPEPLITVTLECEEGELGVAAYASVGVDVVNAGGKARNAEGNIGRLTLECLPRAVVVVGVADGAVFLALGSDDHGKTLRLRADGPVIYKNDRVCFIDYVSFFRAVKAAADDDAGEDAREKLRTFQNALARVDDWQPRPGDNAGFHFNASDGDELLPILRKLKGSGAGIYLTIDNYEKHRPHVTREFVQAVGAVNPRQLTIDCRGFAELKGKLPALESLCLLVTPEDSLPDLSGLKQLRHLYIFNKDSFANSKGDAVDLAPLEGLTQLTALTVMGGAENTHVIGSLRELQFLCVFDALSDPSFSESLPRLRYLGAAFPSTTDFSFVERMPYLQTLGIIEFGPRHELGPLVKAPRLRCLALRPENIGGNGRPEFEEVEQYANVRRFQQERPDVTIVEYGLCLGSWWIVLAVFVGAILASGIRRVARATRVGPRGMEGNEHGSLGVRANRTADAQ